MRISCREVSAVAVFLIAIQSFVQTCTGLSNVNVWPHEVKVVARPAIAKGTFVCCYQGDILTVDEELERYPDRYPDYCLQISSNPKLSIDGENSGHWSRLINHNEKSNLILHTNEADRTAHFTAARDILPEEELCFDYGISYFIFRNIVPAPETESRSLELPTETMEEALRAQSESSNTIPKSPQEIQQVVEDEQLDLDTKKAALMRSLDFYAGVDWQEDEDGQKSVTIPTSLRGERQTLLYSELTLDYLRNVLERIWEESQEIQ